MVEEKEGEIEREVNEKVNAAIDSKIEHKALDEAKRIEDEECIAISVYEFSPEDMF